MGDKCLSDGVDRNPPKRGAFRQFRVTIRDQKKMQITSERLDQLAKDVYFKILERSSGREQLKQ